MRVLLFMLLLFVPALAKPVPVVLWQSEKRIEPRDGETIHLNRRPFRLVIPLKKGEHLGVTGGVGVPPKPLTAFEPGHGMAGPYDGFFLDWEAHHYFYYDPEDPRDRVDLWDRSRGLTTWEVKTFYRRVGSELQDLSWTGLPSITMVVRKDGYQDRTFTIRWRSPIEPAKP